MTHTYTVTGMTCGNCEQKVKSALLMTPNVISAEVSKDAQTAVIEMDKHIPLDQFQQRLGEKYSISAIDHNESAEQAKSWFNTYKPILIVFAYIIGITAVSQYGSFNWMNAMSVFMAGFFITFSFFKMLDIKGFAESYAMYDIVAKRIPLWGFVYPFVELALGVAYAMHLYPVTTNIVTLVVMSVSIVGVLQSVLNKRKIRCACLGAVFNLPMSTITIIEDGLMIAMSLAMLFLA